MSFSDSFKQVIATVAPLIGTAFGGPLGGVAGNFLASKLGIPPGDQKALETAVMSGDPAIMLKLKEADDAFRAHLADIGVQEDQLAYADTANARAREIATKDMTPEILAYLITLGFFGTLAYLIIYGKPATGGDVMLVMVGALGTAWSTIVAYFYGSSAGSAAKTDAINKIAASK
jgi:hypothetical protein